MEFLDKKMREIPQHSKKSKCNICWCSRLRSMVCLFAFGNPFKAGDKVLPLRRHQMHANRLGPGVYFISRCISHGAMHNQSPVTRGLMPLIPL